MVLALAGDSTTTRALPPDAREPLAEAFGAPVFAIPLVFATLAFGLVSAVASATTSATGFLIDLVALGIYSYGLSFYLTWCSYLAVSGRTLTIRFRLSSKGSYKVLARHLPDQVLKLKVKQRCQHLRRGKSRQRLQYCINMNR